MLVDMSIHIKLHEDRQQKLQDFANRRKSSMSEMLRYAVDRLFEEEEVDPAKERILKGLLEGMFVIPRGYKLRSFYLTLYMLAEKYPDASSRAFWGPGVYLGTEDMNHSEVMRRLVKAKEESTNGTGKKTQ